MEIITTQCNGKRQGKCSYFNHYCTELKIRALTIPAILLLIYNLPSAICFAVIYDAINDIASSFAQQPCHSNPNSNSSDNDAVIWMNIVFNLTLVTIPLAGWLADTVISRGKAIYISLWLGWIGALLQALSKCYQYSSCDNYGIYALSGLALIFMLFSVAFMYSTVLAYGMDQLLAYSNIKVRSFIYWYVWVIFLGESIVSFASFLSVVQYSAVGLVLSVATFTLFSVSLCLHFQLRHHFEHIPIPNHYKLVYNVLKHWVQHKYPAPGGRSAFTYWENEIPTRIDLAKEKYGGPYSHENVETVKTFLRVVVVLVALIPYLIAHNPFIGELSDMVSRFKDGDNEYSAFVVNFNGHGLILIAIPLLEFIILPLFPKLEYFLMNSLKGIGLAMILLLISIVTLLLITIIWRSEHQQYTNFCSRTSENITYEISYWILVIPSVPAGIASALTFLCIFQFLCSQAPNGMNGKLIGLHWFIRFVSSDIGESIKLICYNPGLWFNLILLFISVAGIVLYILVSYCYVNRVRNDNLNLRTVIERHFEHQINNSNSSNYDCESIIIVDD